MNAFQLERHMIKEDIGLKTASKKAIEAYKEAEGYSRGFAYTEETGWAVLVTAGQGPIVAYSDKPTEEELDYIETMKENRLMSWW